MTENTAFLDVAWVMICGRGNNFMNISVFCVFCVFCVFSDIFAARTSL